MEDEELVHGYIPHTPRVASVRALEDYKLHLVFDNGEHRVFDVKPLLQYKVFAPLRNPGFFKMVRRDDDFGSVI